MECQSNQRKKFWKPPSFEDFNSATPTKKIKLDVEDFFDEETSIPNETFEPKAVEDLTVHPRKIEEVRNWLKSSVREKACMLLITGPPGCGKTTTVKVTAKAEGFSVKEWINPIDKTDYKVEMLVQSDTYDRFAFSETKQTDKFEDFVFRSSRYNSLFDKGNNTLIVVEDIPNIFVWRPKLFHEFLEKYKINGKSPIVFIVTDDQSLNLHNNLFPNNIKTKFNINNIKFNPVSHGALLKNLKTLTDLYCSEQVSSQFLESISKNSNGDLRSATSDLLLFLRTSNLNKAPKKPKKKFRKCNDGLGADSKPLSLKDNSHDFYHTIGRILYPKVALEKDKLEFDNPHRIFLHDVHKIAEQWSSTFLGILHENYLQTFGKFANIVKGADCFSFCDVLGQHEELEDYCSLVGVIDLMLKNKEPKKTGFNPIKKSAWTNAKKFGGSSDLGIECVKEQLNGRDVLLDLVPFMKFLKVDNNGTDLPEIDGSRHTGKDGNINPEEDIIEIEEFDD